MIGEALKVFGVLAMLLLLPSCGGGGAESSNPQVAGAQRIDPAEFVVVSPDSTTVGYAGAPTDTTGLPVNTGAFLNALLYSLSTGARTLVSIDPPRASAGNGPSAALRISADGRVVAFTSRATNLVAGITYPAPPGGQVVQQLFARNLTTATTQVVSVDRSGTSGANVGDVADNFAISPNGRYVAFSSKATNLVPGVTYPGGNNVFVRDLVARTTELISISSDGTSAGLNGALPIAPVHDSLFPAISDDGRYVAFSSAATNLVAGVGYPRRSSAIANIYLRDRSLRSTRLLSLSRDGTQASNDPCAVPSSPAGRYMTPDASTIVFSCRANNLIPGLLYPTNPSDVYVWRRDTGALALASHSADGTTASNNGAFEAVVSADGRFVAFQSPSSNLVTGVTYFSGGIGPGGPPISNIFRWDRTSNTVQLLTRSRDGLTGADFDTQFPQIGDDGQVVAFGSAATNISIPPVTLTSDDRQNNAAFWTSATNSVRLASVDASNRPKGLVNPMVALSGNGSVIAFLWSSDRSAYVFRR
jgi:hypothetical protein